MPDSDPATNPESGSDGPFAASVSMYVTVNLHPDGSFEECLDDSALQPPRDHVSAPQYGGLAHDVECGECGTHMGDLTFRRPEPCQVGPR